MTFRFKLLAVCLCLSIPAGGAAAQEKQIVGGQAAQEKQIVGGQAAQQMQGGAAATHTRSLRISDGVVEIDGKVVPADRLPESLDVDDLTLSVSYSGDAVPVVDIYGRQYVIEVDGLREAGPGEHDRASFFVGRGAPMPSFRMAPPGVYNYALPPEPMLDSLDEHVTFKYDIMPPGDVADYASHAEVFGQKAREMHEQVLRLEELRDQLADIDLPDEPDVRALEDAARKMTIHAEEAARVAEAMPRLEIQHYLAGIQRKDKALFGRLVDEREREEETIQLAIEIRSMPDGEEKDAKVEDLRRRLDAIFELKQDNRRQEIEQLESRIGDLHEKLEERERLRDEIIEGRLRQLLNLEDELSW